MATGIGIIVVSEGLRRMRNHDHDNHDVSWSEKRRTVLQAMMQEVRSAENFVFRRFLAGEIVEANSSSGEEGSHRWVERKGRSFCFLIGPLVLHIPTFRGGIGHEIMRGIRKNGKRLNRLRKKRFTSKRASGLN